MSTFPSAGEGEMIAARSAGTIVQSKRGMPRLVEFPEHPGDVSGNTVMSVRTQAWDSYGQGWTVAQCQKAGAAVVEDIIEGLWYGDLADTESALEIASEVAIQEPPLLGGRLLSFMIGAKAEISSWKETT